MESGTPHWSYSALNTFLQCPMKYALRYIEHAPEERVGVCFPFGRAFHAALSRVRKLADLTIDRPIRYGDIIADRMVLAFLEQTFPRYYPRD